MTTQSDRHEQSFIDTATGQISMLAVALVIVMAIAWFYVW